MLKHFLTLYFCCSLLIHAGSPELAKGIQDECKNKMDLWVLKMKSASEPTLQASLAKERPDLWSYAKRMNDCISSNLADEWVIEPASWLMKLCISLPTAHASAEDVKFRGDTITTIRNAFSQYHIKSEKLAPACLAITGIGDQASMALLEKIEQQNPSQKVQGVAALARATLLQNLGDEKANMKTRLTLIRKAIVNSADVEIDGVSIAQRAENELYLIRFLSKERIAPDLAGVDASGAPITLSAQAGNVVLLLFWNSSMPEADAVLKIHRELAQKMTGKKFTLIGVNSDPLLKLRALTADGTITWKNFSDTTGELAKLYLNPTVPYVYVLDQNRKVQYFGAPGSFAELTADALLSEKK